MSAENAKSPRQIIAADAAWKFFLGDPSGAEELSFRDASWRIVDLPETLRNSAASGSGSLWISISGFACLGQPNIFNHLCPLLFRVFVHPYYSLSGLVRNNLAVFLDS